MTKHASVVFSIVISLLASPMLAHAGNKHHDGTPYVLRGMLEQVKEINGKIDGLDSDDDNPLLEEILTEIQGLRGDVASSSVGGATIKGAKKSEGLITSPGNGTTHDLVTITGSGTFVAARMTKQGGASNITTVELVIDGQTIVGRTYAALDNWGMTQNNPYGTVLLHGNGIDAVTIGFPQPIEFEDSLILRTNVGESDIVQMIGTVIYGQ